MWFHANPKGNVNIQDNQTCIKSRTNLKELPSNFMSGACIMDLSYTAET